MLLLPLSIDYYLKSSQTSFFSHKLKKVSKSLIALVRNPGLWLENKVHQGSHFFNSKGGFVRHAQLQLWRGIKCIFAVIKELKGLHLQSLFQNIPIHSLIFSSFMLLKGLFLTIKGINVFNTAVGGGVCSKRQKALEGLLKLGND